MVAWVDIIGWMGMVILLIAYLLVSLKKVDSQSVGYQLMNVVGSIFVGLNAYWYGAMPPVALEIAWVLIGLFILYRVLGRKHESKEQSE